MSSLVPQGDFFERLAAEVEPAAAGAIAAPPRLKSRIYSALVRRQSASGPLLSLTATKAADRCLCFFEEIWRAAPTGEKAKSLNVCRVCHARVLAENLEKAPIYWPNCPYVKFQKS